MLLKTIQNSTFSHLEAQSRLVKFISLVISVFLIFIGALAVPNANAANKTFYSKASESYVNAGEDLVDASGNETYCMNVNKHAPSKDGTEMTEYNADKGYDYLMYHGYPSTNTINGKTWSDRDAYAIVQYACWLYENPDNVGTADTIYYSGPSKKQDILNAANHLYKGAKAYKGGGVEAGFAHTYKPASKDDKDVQNMILPSSTGWLKLHKASTNPLKTDSRTGQYSIAKAVYGVYSKESCSDSSKVIELTTDSTGNTKSVKLRAGTYYVKEITASKGFKLDGNTHKVKVSAKHVQKDPCVLNVKEEPETGTIKLSKVSKSPVNTDGNSSYSVTGAVYTVYGDAALTDVLGTITTDSQGNGSLGNLPLGPVWIKEQTASKGYRLDVTAHKATIVADEVVKVTSQEEPQYGRIRIEKNSTAPGFLNYKTYSLSNAKYEVRNSKGELKATLVTDAYGRATSADLPLGSYTIKEVVAPKGFTLKITPDTITLTEDNVTKGLPTTDSPTTYTGADLAAKADADMWQLERGYGYQGNAELAKAEYELCYYDDYYTDASQLPAAPVLCSSISSTLLNGKTVLNLSDANRVDTGAGYKGLPLGTYTLRETKAPTGYQIDPTVHVFQCRQDSALNGYLQVVRPSGGQPSSVTEVSADQTISATNRIVSTETIKRGDLSISKYIETAPDPDYWEDMKHGAEGVSFEIVNANPFRVLRVDSLTWAQPGEVVYTITTDKQGYASTRYEMSADGLTGIKNNATASSSKAPGTLAFGTYLIREVPETTPEGYKPIDAVEFSIGENNQYEHKIFNNKTGTVVEIHKVDSETGKTVSGVTSFQILDASMNPVVFTLKYPVIEQKTVLTTDPKGTVMLPDKLLVGTYYIKEIAAPWGYVWNDNLIRLDITSETVNDYDRPLVVEFPDNPAKGIIEIVKKDVETGDPITRAPAIYDVFAAEDIITQDGTLRAAKDELVDTIVTDGTGSAKTSELYIGNYYIVEKTAPYGYVRSDERIDVEIPYGGDRVAVVEVDAEQSDIPVKGGFSIVKKDAETGGIMTVPGVEFDVRAAENIIGGDGHVWYTKGEIVDHIITDDNGIAVMDKLVRIGQYEFVETKAPYGYVLDDTPVPVELRYADQNTPIVSAQAEQVEQPTVNEFKFVKLDRETGKTVWTSKCEIAVYAAQDIVRGDGSIKYHKDDFIGSAVTDETGSIRTSLNLRCGKYYLKEANAPAGYILDSDRIYQVEATWGGGAVSSQTHDASVSDVPAKGVITFTKADIETGKTIPVAGIKADVYANEDIVTGDGTVRYHAGEKVAELETDENGNAETPELYLGSYRVIETFAPEGYLINETPVNVSLNYEGQTVPVTTSATQILDENAKGVIEVTKIDKETGKTVPLPGTTFEIRAKTDIITPDGTIRLHTGELACEPVVTDENGAAITPELYLGIYTITETKAPHGYTLDTTPHDAVIAYKDQHTPVVFSTESIANTVQKGVIQVTKTDSESGQPILTPGVIFEIKAVEDIITPDGTLRAQAGEIVDTIETDDTGIASSKALYLGKYEVYETQAPAGYLLSDEVKQVELVYGDQTAPLVYEMTSVADQVVKGTITVHKEDSDLDEPLPGVVYEVRASEDIVTGDGVTHYAAGDVIDTLITGVDGSATSSELYLGEYVVAETVQPNGYILDEKEYPVHLRYADQHTPVVHEDITLYNTPTTVHVKKVSLNDNTLVVPGTQFVGWRAEEEAEIEDAFAVFAGDGIEITRASIDYLGDFTQTGVKEVQDSFVLTKREPYREENSYVVFSSAHSLNMGDYVLHVSYTRTNAGNSTVEKDIPFVVNEYDKNAYFAIGTEIISTGGNANIFASLGSDESDPEKPEETITPDVPDSDETDNSSNPTPDTTEGIDSDTQAQDIVDDEIITDNDNVNEPSNSENPDNPEEGNDIAPAPDGDNMSAPALGVPDTSDEIDVRVDRVPTILSTGHFTWAVTDDDGIAEFKYVQQGQIAFAEFEPAAGYVSDRTPGYVEIGTNGQASNTTVEGNITLPETPATDTGIIDLDMVFADDLTKLYISKKDITTSDELPGNTLSVYEYESDGTSDEVMDSDYGDLVESWVSADEPHYMELLPQGTYILKEEQAVDGYTVAESIIFRLNDTGVEQHVLMNNEHETAVADELIDTGFISLTGDTIELMIVAGAIICGIVMIFIGLIRRAKQ